MVDSGPVRYPMIEAVVDLGAGLPGRLVVRRAAALLGRIVLLGDIAGDCGEDCLTGEDA